MTIYATPHGTATPNPYAARIAATEGASVVTCCEQPSSGTPGGMGYRYAWACHLHYKFMEGQSDG